MYERLRAEARACGTWPAAAAARSRALEAAAAALFTAYLERALVCPVRFERLPSSWVCSECGARDRYERLVMAWVSLRAEGDPDDETEEYTEIMNDVLGTIRCLACGMDDNMDEILRTGAFPDWSINLDGTARETVW